MKRIYVSYAYKDKDKAASIVNFLEKNGLKCFIAPRDVDDTTSYAKTLITAIKNSPLCLVLMSKAANESEHLLSEVDAMVSNRIPVLPVFIEEVQLRDDFRYYLGRKHWVIAYPDEISTYFEKIYKTVSGFAVEAVNEKERAEHEAEIARQKSELEKLKAELAAAKAAAAAPLQNGEVAPHKHVFISYKSEEYDVAAKTVEILKENGINCWMAPHSIPAGSDYGAEIPAAIADCAAFVVILSDVAQQSRWIPKEIDAAINADKVIIPFHIDQCPIGAAFNFRISNNQRIEAFNRMTQAYGELVERLHAIINKGESK